MDIEEFRKNGHQLIDRIAEYYENIEQYPVKSLVEPKEIYNSLPASAPEFGEDFDLIIRDFDQKLMKGITHWQNPSFFAYFNANTSFPSILGELLTSAIGAQCMVWETSPAAAELEEMVCNWMKQACALPENWEGVIQDTASTATICALLTAREKHSNFMINKYGFRAGSRYIVYCSSEAHSSVEKGAKIVGFGSDQVRKIRVDNLGSMMTDVLNKQIVDDLNEGFIPLCVVSAVGTTGTHGIDNIRSNSEICKRYNIFHHVDAAHAGNAAIIPEYRQMIDGLELADSYVFNPHKWMFTNFDCSLYYVKDKNALIKTFEILPEYLKTNVASEVNNYRDWGIQLGRRFRALKLWIVLRSYGLEGIRSAFRKHISFAQEFAAKIEQDPGFELSAPVPLNLVCFRYIPNEKMSLDKVNHLNQMLKNKINETGKAYITHTKLQDKYILRMCIGQTNVEQKHIDNFWKLLTDQISGLE